MLVVFWGLEHDGIRQFARVWTQDFNLIAGQAWVVAGWAADAIPGPTELHQNHGTDVIPSQLVLNASGAGI